MLNKRIKSLLVAGLLVLGMSGQSFAAETKAAILEVTTIDNNVAEYNKDGIEIDIVNITGNAIPEYTENPDYYDGTGQYIGPVYDETTYFFSIKWDPSKIKAIGSEIVYLNASTGFEDYIQIPIDNENGKAVLTRTLVPASIIYSVDLGYELIDNNEEEQQLTVEEKIIKNYIDKMNSTNVGVRDDATKTRVIGKEYAISKDEWDAHIEQIKATGGLKVVSDVGNNQYSGRYEIRSEFSDELIEIIEIEFFDATGAKGWLPEITPGTGQALAVGGIVIGAAAAVGLLVNNRKRKDEE